MIIPKSQPSLHAMESETKVVVPRCRKTTLLTRHELALVLCSDMQKYKWGQVFYRALARSLMILLSKRGY